MHKRLSAKERAYLAPLCHAFDRKTHTAYVATGGRTASNLRLRPRAALECDDYYEDWDRLRGIVAHVRARFVVRGPELERARQLLNRKFTQYRKLEIDSVIALRVEEAVSWGL